MMQYIISAKMVKTITQKYHCKVEILSNNKFYININGMGNQSFRIAEKVI